MAHCRCRSRIKNSVVFHLHININFNQINTNMISDEENETTPKMPLNLTFALFLENDWKKTKIGQIPPDVRLETIEFLIELQQYLGPAKERVATYRKENKTSATTLTEEENKLCGSFNICLKHAVLLQKFYSEQSISRYVSREQFRPVHLLLQTTEPYIKQAVEKINEKRKTCSSPPEP